MRLVDDFFLYIFARPFCTFKLCAISRGRHSKQQNSNQKRLSMFEWGQCLHIYKTISLKFDDKTNDEAQLWCMIHDGALSNRFQFQFYFVKMFVCRRLWILIPMTVLFSWCFEHFCRTLLPPFFMRCMLNLIKFLEFFLTRKLLAIFTSLLTRPFYVSTREKKHNNVALHFSFVKHPQAISFFFYMK